MASGRKHYYLFQYAPGHTRIGTGRTVQEACRDAFGMVYGLNSGVKYKDMGTRSSAWRSTKDKAKYYEPNGWLDIPA